MSFIVDVKNGDVGVANSGQLIDKKEHKVHENREAKFREKLRKENFFDGTYFKETVQTTGFVDSNGDKKYNDGEEEGLVYETTIYRFPQSALDNPKFIKFLAKEGYVEVPGYGYIYGGKNPKKAVENFQTAYVDVLAKGDAYSKSIKKKNNGVDQGNGRNGSGVYGQDPLNKHTKKQPTVADQGRDAVDANKNKKDPKDSGRKTGSDTPVTGIDTADKRGPMSVGRFEELTLFELHSMVFSGPKGSVKFDLPPSVTGESGKAVTKGNASNEGLHLYYVKPHDKEEARQVFTASQQSEFHHIVRDPETNNGYLFLNDAQYQMWKNAGLPGEIKFEDLSY